MKKISLFIAMSLDGYIADNKGSVNWLVGQSNEDNDIDSYSEFVKDIEVDPVFRTQGTQAPVYGNCTKQLPS